MSDFYNPFKENRTEQMKDLWKYYVPFPGLGSEGKPLFVEGGRGSGKTMFFQCNSWRQVALKIKKENRPTTDVLKENGFVGLYYRVDTTFVSSMRGQEETRWGSIFETYLSICILKEILDLIIALAEDEEVEIDETKLSEFSQLFSRKLNPCSTIDTIQDFQKESDFYLDLIEDKINGICENLHTQLRYVTAHRFINDLCSAFIKMFSSDTLLFKIFIDEYETLQEYQQKIVNTLIKHSSLPVIFNIGLRPKGIKTFETISNTETIESPHDYERLILGFDDDKYPEIVKTICQKRIALGKEENRIPANASENIEYYFGKYSMDYELSKLTQSKNKLPHIKKLEQIIRDRGKKQKLSEEEIELYISTLCNNAPIINSRIHYALLCKETHYTPTIKQLYDSYSSNTKKYSDWMHNRKNGAMFLLCKETKREKMYYGFDIYVALSSNIVRYFLELCEHAFKIAFLNGYSWEKPIAPEIQTEAARYVSEYKIVDIAGYEPYGRELRIFTQYIGQIFYKLHTYEENTLGEPEPNHFNTKDLSLSEKTKKLISSAIMWNVLQEGEATKKKQSKLSPETIDYFLNKIYVPYFGISHRNQRKITVNVEILDQLFSGDENEAKKGFQNFFKNLNTDKVSTDDDIRQITLFDN